MWKERFSLTPGSSKKNLVYVLGFSNKYCNPDLLRKNDYFGQFGTITKLIISPRNKVGNQSSFAVYVTYQNSEEAARAIAALDGSEVDGKFLKACYGTTKYCANFLKQMPCTNPTCLYLHEITKDSEYAVSTSNRFALKTAMPPFSSQSSEAKRSERRSNVNRGFSVNMKDLRGSALPATASWAKGPGSSLDIGSKSSGDVAMDFPALLPVRHESNHTPKPSAKRKEWQESPREPITPKPKSPSPIPDEEDFYEDVQMDALTPGTKTPADTAALTASVPLSDNDVTYSSEEEKEEQMLSEQDDSEWEQLPPELREASPSHFIDSERETESTSASNERATEKKSEMIQIQRVQSASEDYSNFFFPLEVSLDPVPNSPRLEFGRSQQFRN
ncbi:transcriptional repressor negative regulator of transcription subunit 4 [Entomophthora muscae]|uniref:Transcriptional repressor negative regulator of transcription subunit 4 n=1 Tax=Entomophthora muscae TaxID=34485 RepID=A0ACC2SMR5_9FUNG|nr:transcriptional repressor negative regulator of transcription subunit 4 [Entomophthora muscae]